jgi:DNA mismatch repair protein MutL
MRGYHISRIDLLFFVPLKCHMPQIKILPPGLRNKIAAGEVIERPASVVKELIENSIDAGSSEIDIDVLYSGKRLIRVSDNGSGMDREDALLCFERHATSKLAAEDDLFHIETMGFRGEALSSIASVSRVRLVTGRKKPVQSGKVEETEEVGVSVEITGGEVKEIKDSPAVGTSVEVKDLFFNTPARKKFLKSNSTELFHIIDTVTKEALSHWRIAFRLLSDNRETMDVSLSSGPRERIMQIYGGEFTDGLTEINADVGAMKLNAFVTKGDNFRKMKSHQLIFINSRPVKDHSISHAVYRAYEGMLPDDMHPVFFLFLDIEPGKIDFNVHPAKREVRFEDKESVYRFVMDRIRQTVKGERAEFVKQFADIPSPDHPLPSPYSYREHLSSPSVFQGSAISEDLELAYTASLPSLYLGDTFIAVSGKGGLMLIDHHAAHERILHEKFLKGISLGSHYSLFPIQVKLSPGEYTAILENTRLLKDFGMEVDDFGHDTIVVRSLPDVLKDSDIRGILSDIAACMIEGVPPDKSFKEALAARIACHSSVRGKEILDRDEISKLITDLELTDNPDQCPHGRPTRIFFSLDDLKKMFKRR